MLYLTVCPVTMGLRGPAAGLGKTLAALTLRTARQYSSQDKHLDHPDTVSSSFSPSSSPIQRTPCDHCRLTALPGGCGEHAGHGMCRDRPLASSSGCGCAYAIHLAGTLYGERRPAQAAGVFACESYSFSISCTFPPKGQSCRSRWRKGYWRCGAVPSALRFFRAGWLNHVLT